MLIIVLVERSCFLSGVVSDLLSLSWPMPRNECTTRLRVFNVDRYGLWAKKANARLVAEFLMLTGYDPLNRLPNPRCLAHKVG